MSYRDYKPPAPDEWRTYYIGMKHIQVSYQGIPPCLWCGEPVTSPSMDGPLVCALCDMGKNRDGTNWDTPMYQERLQHFMDEVKKAEQSLAEDLVEDNRV